MIETTKLLITTRWYLSGKKGRSKIVLLSWHFMYMPFFLIIIFMHHCLYSCFLFIASHERPLYIFFPKSILLFILLIASLAFSNFSYSTSAYPLTVYLRIYIFYLSCIRKGIYDILFLAFFMETCHKYNVSDFTPLQVPFWKVLSRRWKIPDSPTYRSLFSLVTTPENECSCICLDEIVTNEEELCRHHVNKKHKDCLSGWKTTELGTTSTK